MTFLKCVVITSVVVNGALLAASASADNSPPDSGKESGETASNPALEGPFEYELRSRETTRQDDRFPFGNWRVSRLYPELVSESQPSQADAANERIADLVNQYRCEDMGDESFKTQEVYLDSGIFSMAYEAMWMCASMPSPESESGYLNIDLANGEELDLEAQFRNLEAYERFQASAIRELNRALKAQVADGEETCPRVRSFNGFHVDGKDLWVASLPRDGEPTHCGVKVSFALESLKKQIKPTSPILAGAQPSDR